METITPKAEMFLLPDGTREAKHAEHQEEYGTLPTLVTPDGRVVSQWRPDANDLAMLNTGGCDTGPPKFSFPTNAL